MYIMGGSNTIQALIATHNIQVVSYEGRVLEPGNTNNILLLIFHDTFFASFVYFYTVNTRL